MFCTECGAELPEGLSFCTVCGAPIAPEEGDPAAAVTTPQDMGAQTPGFTGADTTPGYQAYQQMPMQQQPQTWNPNDGTYGVYGTNGQNQGGNNRKMTTTIGVLVGAIVAVLVIVGFLVFMNMGGSTTTTASSANQSASAQASTSKSSTGVTTTSSKTAATTSSTTSTKSSTTNTSNNNTSSLPSSNPYRSITSDYVFPDSSSSYLSDSQVRSLSQAQAKIARNEIYARHHRLFKDDDLQAYFNSKSWYSGSISADSFSESVFSDTERENINKIKAYESSQGWS